MRTRRAFTLVELLVVLGILALLAALLFPVLAEARENARAKRCLSQVRQLAQSTLMYLSDWSDAYPLAAYVSQHDNQPCLFTLYHELVPYIRDKQIVICPSDPAPMDVARVFAQVMTLCPAMGFQQSSYMANWCLFEVGTLLGKVFHPPIHGAQVEFPSETVMYFDAVMGGLPSLIPFIQGRHHERMNVALGDGHAKSWKTRRSYGTIRRVDGRVSTRYCLIELTAYYRGDQRCVDRLFGLAGRNGQGHPCWRCPSRPRGSGWYLEGTCGE